MSTKTNTSKKNLEDNMGIAKNSLENVPFVPLLETMRLTRNQLIECLSTAEEIRRLSHGNQEEPTPSYDCDIDNIRAIVDSEAEIINRLLYVLTETCRDLVG